MNTQTLLDHVSDEQKNATLEALLSALQTPTGELDVDQDPNPEHLVALLQDYATRLHDAAENNLAAIAKVTQPDDEGALDDLVHDNASDIGSDVNNGGFSEQVRYLIVELGMSPEKVNGGIEAGSDGCREIPRG